MKKTTLLMGALAACILSTHQVQAALYNVQFGGNTAQGGAYEAPLQTGAGIVGTAGDTWNYVNTVGLATLTSATGINLNDSSNVGSTVFLKGNGTNAASFATSTAQLQSTILANLYQGFVFTTTTNYSYTFSGLGAFAPFDLYTYAAADSSGATREYEFSLDSAFTTFDRLGPNNNSNTLSEGTSQASVPGTNYSVLSGAADASGNFTVYTRFNSGGSTTVNGFQLNAIPEPSSMALVGLGACALLARRRRNAA